MDSKIKVKEEDPLLDDIVADSHSEVLLRNIIVKPSNDAELVDNDCNISLLDDIVADSHSEVLLRNIIVKPSNDAELVDNDCNISLLDDIVADSHSEVLLRNIIVKPSNDAELVDNDCNISLLDDTVADSHSEVLLRNIIVKASNDAELVDNDCNISLLDDIVADSHSEVLLRNIIVKTSNDAELVDNDCNISISTKVKSEISDAEFCSQKEKESFTKHLVRPITDHVAYTGNSVTDVETEVEEHRLASQIERECLIKCLVKHIKSEADEHSSNCTTEAKSKVEGKTVISDSDSQIRRECFTRQLVIKLKKCDNLLLKHNEIETTQEPRLPESATSSVCQPYLVPEDVSFTSNCVTDDKTEVEGQSFVSQLKRKCFTRPPLIKLKKCDSDTLIHKKIETTQESRWLESATSFVCQPYLVPEDVSFTSNCVTDDKTEVEGQSFVSQLKRKCFTRPPLIKLKKCDSDTLIHKKIETTQESRWLESATSSVCQPYLVNEVPEDVSFTSNCVTDDKTEVEGQSFVSQLKRKCFTRPPLIKLKKCDSDTLIHKKIETTQESRWPESATSSVCQPYLVPEDVSFTSNCVTDDKTEVEGQSFVSQLKRECFTRRLIIKLKRCDSDTLIHKKIEATQESRWLESATSSVSQPYLVNEVPEDVSFTSNCVADDKTEVEGQSFVSQLKRKCLTRRLIIKLKKCDSDTLIHKKIDVIQEPRKLEIGTLFDSRHIKDGKYPGVKSPRLHSTSGVSGTELQLPTGEDSSSYGVKYRSECEAQESDVTKVPPVEKHLHSGQPCQYSHETERSYTTKSNLKEHQLINSSGKRHKCQICDKKFIRLSHLKLHFSIHQYKNPYQCLKCEKCFTKLSSLESHSLVHENEKPHKCEKFDQRFPPLSALKTHSVVHKGQKPFRCTVCDKRFTTSHHLRNHSWIHGLERSFKCEVCGKGFYQLSDLKVHGIVHKSKTLCT